MVEFYPSFTEIRLSVYNPDKKQFRTFFRYIQVDNTWYRISQGGYWDINVDTASLKYFKEDYRSLEKTYGGKFYLCISQGTVTYIIFKTSEDLEIETPLDYDCPIPYSCYPPVLSLPKELHPFVTTPKDIVREYIKDVKEELFDEEDYIEEIKRKLIGKLERSDKVVTSGHGGHFKTIWIKKFGKIFKLTVFSWGELRDLQYACINVVSNKDDLNLLIDCELYLHNFLKVDPIDKSYIINHLFDYYAIDDEVIDYHPALGIIRKVPPEFYNYI